MHITAAQLVKLEAWGVVPPGHNGGPLTDDQVQHLIELSIAFDLQKAVAQEHARIASAALVDPRLSDRHRVAMHHVLERTELETGVAEAPRKELARATGYAEGTIKNAISDLVELGYLCYAPARSSSRVVARYAVKFPDETLLEAAVAEAVARLDERRRSRPAPPSNPSRDAVLEELAEASRVTAAVDDVLARGGDEALAVVTSLACDDGRSKARKSASESPVESAALPNGRRGTHVGAGVTRMDVTPARLKARKIGPSTNGASVTGPASYGAGSPASHHGCDATRDDPRSEQIVLNADPLYIEDSSNNNKILIPTTTVRVSAREGGGGSELTHDVIAWISETLSMDEQAARRAALSSTQIYGRDVFLQAYAATRAEQLERGFVAAPWKYLNGIARRLQREAAAPRPSTRQSRSAEAWAELEREAAEIEARKASARKAAGGAP